MENSAKKRIVIYGGAFNPPGRHHIEIVEKLAEKFHLVIIRPCGNREDKPLLQKINAIHRIKMVLMGFSSIPNVRFDFEDLEKNTYTYTCDLAGHYQAQYPDAQIWFAVGQDIIDEVPKWKNGPEIWKSLNFAVMAGPNFDLDSGEMPQSYILVDIETDLGWSSTVIRERIAEKLPIDELVTPEIGRYIMDNRLYQM